MLIGMLPGYLCILQQLNAFKAFDLLATESNFLLLIPVIYTFHTAHRRYEQYEIS